MSVCAVSLDHSAPLDTEVLAKHPLIIIETSEGLIDLLSLQYTVHNIRCEYQRLFSGDNDSLAGSGWDISFIDCNREVVYYKTSVGAVFMSWGYTFKVAL